MAGVACCVARGIESVGFLERVSLPPLLTPVFVCALPLREPASPAPPADVNRRHSDALLRLAGGSVVGDNRNKPALVRLRFGIVTSTSTSLVAWLTFSLTLAFVLALMSPVYFLKASTSVDMSVRASVCVGAGLRQDG